MVGLGSTFASSFEKEKKKIQCLYFLINFNFYHKYINPYMG